MKYQIQIDISYVLDSYISVIKFYQALQDFAAEIHIYTRKTQPHWTNPF